MFIPRHPVVQNQFCQFAETDTSTGVGGVLAYAGAVCYLEADASNQEAIVNIYNESDTYAGTEILPFGFLMQKVKTGYHQVHPAGFYMPGDLGSSDVIAQPKYSAAGAVNGTKTAPVGVAHLGIWDTVHYSVTTAGTTVVYPGDLLYADGTTTSLGKIRNSNDAIPTNVVASVGRVMKGASAAQASANVGNTTLYPIRIKLSI